MLTGITDNASCSSEDEVSAEEIVSMEKSINLTSEITYSLEKENGRSEIYTLHMRKNTIKTC